MPLKKDTPNKDKKDQKEKAKIQLTSNEMKDFAGDFYSLELDLVYHVWVKNEKLMLRHRKGESIMTPTAAGKFTCSLAGTATMDFLRDADKRVVGFTIGVPQCRGIRFGRIELGKGL